MKKQTATLLFFLTILFSFVVPVNSYNIEANTQPGIFSKDEIYCELSESDIFQALKENPFSAVKLLMKYAFNHTYVIYEKFKSLFAANHEKWIDGKIKEIKKDYFVVIPDVNVKSKCRKSPNENVQFRQVNYSSESSKMFLPFSR